MNFNRFEVYGNPTLQQGGWVRTGVDNDYVKYSDSFDPNYAYRTCTLDYVPQHHPTQITITGIASKELEVSVLVLRSDNYIISSLGWHDNGYTFNLGSTYDKLGVMFRFKNGDAITPNHGSTDIKAWTDIPHYIHNTSTDTITTLPTVIYANDTTATVGLKGNMEQSGTPSPTTPIQPQECGELETEGTKAGQYKIPILNNSQTTNVYLGEVETTRIIRKYEFTGQETFYESAQTSVFYTTAIANLCNKTVIYNIGCLCNAYKLHKQTMVANLQDGEYTTDGNGYLWFRNYDYATLTDFKAYLTQQYTNDTPVCVWYVLATPQTAVVNEPIRKIGDYADEVSGITIPVTAGANAVDVLTTLKPSEVTATYKGWHPVADVHERENGAWT